MTRLELKPAASITIVFGGEEFQCIRPNVEMQINMEAELEKARDKKVGAAKVMADYVIACGLPQRVVYQLNEEQMEAVCEVLTAKKK